MNGLRLACLMFVALWMAGLLPGCSRTTEAPDTGTPQVSTPIQRPTIIALGKLLPESGVINVGATPGDRIEELRVDIGSQVQVGDILLVLSSRDIRQKELELAKSRLEDARKQQELQQTIAKEQIALAESAKSDGAAFESEKESALNLIAAQQQKVDLAAKQLADLQALFDSQANRDRDLVTQSELENAKVELSNAEAELRQARSQLQVAEEKQNVSRNSVDANVRVAEQQLAAAEGTSFAALEAAVRLAEENLDRATVRAPIDGSVINLFSHQGDMVGNQPVLRLADLSQMICIAEVYESQLALVDPSGGQNAQITSPALYDRQTGEPITLSGTVYRRSALIGQATLLDPNPLAPQDRRTAEVFIRLDSNSSEIAASFVQLQVQVRIDVGGPSGD